MSKAVKKVFKGVKKAVKGVGDAVSGVVSKTAEFVQKNWKEIVLVTAAVFTAGAALGYVGMSGTGGLAFGAGSSAGGLSGIGAAWGGLGNTVAGALGMNPQFGAATIAQGGSSVAAQTAAVQTAAAGGAAPAAAAPAAAAPAATAGAAEGAAAAANTVGAGATSAQAVSKDIVEKGLLERAGDWAGKQSLGDWAQGGGLGLATYGAWQEGQNGDDPMRYAEYDAYAPKVASAQDVVGSGIQAAAPGGNAQRGLMQPTRTSRQSSRDDEARRRYGRAYA